MRTHLSGLGTQKFIPLLTVILMLCISGCAPGNSASQKVIPVTGAGQLQVEEYPLVEQSIDNPTHRGFLDRIPGAVVTRRAPWRSPVQNDVLDAPNQALMPQGFHLAMNPDPPFSAYALYQGDQVIQTDIRRFWPVTVNAASNDFLLPYETLDGNLLVATRSGFKSWSKVVGFENAPPVYIGDRLAYTDDEGSMFLDMASQESVSEDTFGWQVIQGHSFYFFNHEGVLHLSYNGKTLPNKYDQIVYDAVGEAALYNPGGNENMVWFYALRDGLWYYVEAGIFE